MPNKNPTPKPTPTTPITNPWVQLGNPGQTTSSSALQEITTIPEQTVNAASAAAGGPTNVIIESNADLTIDGNHYSLQTDQYGNTGVQQISYERDSNKKITKINYLGSTVPIVRNGKVTAVTVNDAVAQMLQTANPTALKNQLFERGLISQDDLAKDINDTNIVAGITRGLNAMAAKNFNSIQSNNLKSVINPEKFTSFIQTYDPGLAYRNLLQGKQKAYADIKTSAFDNGITLPENFINSNADAIANSKIDFSKVQEQIRSIAKNTYPAFAEGLSQGIDLSTLAHDYIQTAQNVLELPIDQIMPTAKNSPLRNILGAKDASGKPMLPSLADAEKSMYQDSRWMNTKNAAQTFQGLYSALADGLRA